MTLRKFLYEWLGIGKPPETPVLFSGYYWEEREKQDRLWAEAYFANLDFQRKAKRKQHIREFHKRKRNHG